MLAPLRFALDNFLNYQKQRLCYHFDLDACRPTQVFLLLTSRCCLRCGMCGVVVDRGDSQRELETETWKRILSELRDWLGDSSYVQFTGGEPLLRSDLVDLIAFANGLGFRTLLNSNGYLIDEMMADRLVEAGLNFLTISLDGVAPATFDALRGVEGAHQRVTAGIRLVNQRKRPGMMVGISAVVTKANLGEIVPLIDWVNDHHLDRLSLHALQNRPGSPAANGEDVTRHELWVDDLEQLDQVVDEVIERKKNGSPIINTIKHLQTLKRYYHNPMQVRQGPCMVGLNNFRIAWDGTVRLCYQMDSLGDLKQQSPQQVWQSREAKAARRLIKTCSRLCTAKCVTPQSLLEKAQLFYFMCKKGQFRPAASS